MLYAQSVLSRTEEPAKTGTCARDRRALQLFVLNVHVKHSDLLNQNSVSISEPLFFYIKNISVIAINKNVLNVSLNNFSLTWICIISKNDGFVEIQVYCNNEMMTLFTFNQSVVAMSFFDFFQN